MDDRKTIGIIGGMGPLATADLFEKIIAATPAKCDQEHLHVLIDSDPLIPDRTAAILHGGESPVPRMTAAARRLEAGGAKLLLIPCNAAHYFYDAVQASCRVPLMHMLRETAAWLHSQGVSRVGLLATDGIVATGVYERALRAEGVELVLPDAAGQREVMDIVYSGVKAGRRDLDASAFEAVCRGLLDGGAQTLVLGCTELPLAFSMYGIDLPHADPTDILAKAAVKAAMGSWDERCG